MYQRRYQYVASKWTKAQQLIKNENIERHMLETRLLTYDNLKEMIDKYPMVYVKPDTGMKGKGIIRVSHDGETFAIHTVEQRFDELSFSAFIENLKGLVQKHKFVIQQGIELLKYEDHPVDFRVLMQRPEEEWQYSGIVGKMGSVNSIITNYASGGKAIPFRQVISDILNWDYSEIKILRDSIKELCLEIANQLSIEFPGLRELGVDLAIDRKGNVWILEVNTTPGHQLFRHLENKKLYQRIVKNVLLIQENT